jgi:3-oxoacyl-[acyl-carrier protein] reductase
LHFHGLYGIVSLSIRGALREEAAVTSVHARASGVRALWTACAIGDGVRDGPAAPEARVAIVTGSSRGIGRATAVALARAGCRVVVNHRDSAGEARQTAREVEEILPGGCVVVQADVTREADAARLVSETLARLGRLDILVNNAGISGPRTFLDIDPAEWDRMIAGNLTSVYLCCRAAIPAMLGRGWGRIINISSTSGVSGGTSGAHYAASKGGVISLTRALASELAPRGITVNAVVPSKIDTEMLRSAVGEAGLAGVAEKIPVRRIGTPREIAALVAFLASEEAGYITGEAITASGGYR